MLVAGVRAISCVGCRGQGNILCWLQGSGQYLVLVAGVRAISCSVSRTARITSSFSLYLHGEVRKAVGEHPHIGRVLYGKSVLQR